MIKEFKRARGDDEKHARRLAILQAAEELYELEPTHLPTVADIGKKAQIAKGTLYLYFRSKEEIFLALLEKTYMEWFTTLESAVQAPDLGTGDVIDCICSFVENRPKMLQLSSISPTLIEQNVSEEVLVDYKTKMHGALVNASLNLSNAVPELNVEEAANMMLRSYALLQGLWLIANPPESVKVVLEKHELHTLSPDFASHARAALTSIWRIPS